MLKRNLKIVVRQTLQISVAVMLVCGFVTAQKNRKPVSADGYAKRGAAKMKIAESLANSAADVKRYEEAVVGSVRSPTAAEKKYEEAIEDFNEAIELNPDDAAFYLKRGNCRYKTSDIQRAVSDFSKAIERDPDLAEAYLERGKVIADLHLSDEDREETVKRAFADFDKAIEINYQLDIIYGLKINSGNPNYHYIRGKLHEMRENFQDALKDLNKAIEINPRFADALVLRAKVYRQLRNYEKSIADSTKGISFNKKNIEGLETRGRAFADSGKYELAIADYTAALRLKPNDPTLYFYRAFAYSKLGKTSEAETDTLSEKKFSVKFWNRNAGKLPEFGNQGFYGLSKSMFDEDP